jgi:excisionase family DNA binding protein
LFTQSHPGVNADNKLGQMLGKARGYYLVDPVVFLTAYEANATSPLFPLPHQSRRVNTYFTVANALAIAERGEGLIAVRCSRRFAASSEPPLTVAVESKILASREEAAQMLSISQRALDYLIATRRLPTRRIGGRVLIAVSELRRYARSDHPERIVA